MILFHKCQNPSVKYTIENVDRPFSTFAKAALFPIYDSSQSIFTFMFTTFGYSFTYALANMYHFLIDVSMNCDFYFLS